MKTINLDTKFVYFTKYFQGMEVRIKRERATGQIYFSYKSVVKLKFFANENETKQNIDEFSIVSLNGMKGFVTRNF